MHKHLSLVRHAAFFGLLLGLGTTPLAAVAGSFTATADATLALVEVSSQGSLDDLLITRSPFDLADAETGATAGALVTLGPLSGRLFRDALGTEIAGGGDSRSATEAALSLTLDNGTGDTVALLFELAYAMQVGIGGRGDAYADALVSLFVDGFLLSGTGDLFETIIADQITGPRSANRAGNLSFRLELLPGEVAMIDLVISHFGESQVPVPPPLALFATGLLALATGRVRARRT